MKSIRTDLTIKLLIGLLILIISFDIALYYLVKNTTLKVYDRALDFQIRTIATILENDPKELDEDLKRFLPEFERTHNSEYLQVWFKNGDILKRPNINFELPKNIGTMRAPFYMNLKLPDGRPGRAVGISLYLNIKWKTNTPIRQGIEIVLARDTSILNNNLNILKLELFFGSLFNLILMGFYITLYVKKSLTPLNILAEATNKIDHKTLNYEFNIRKIPNEIRPIANKLNELLSRLKKAFDREKRLTADMAHELKTPIAELKTLAEVNLEWPEESRNNTMFLKNVLSISNQMRKVVSTILAIVRAEEKRDSLFISEFNLNKIFKECLKSIESMINAKNISLELKIPKDISLHTDKDIFVLIFNNLIVNAAQYCPLGGYIEIDVYKEMNKICIRIKNKNDSLKQEDLDRIFEPLWRKYMNRGEGGNSGLGLSLVKAYTELLGCDIQVELNQSKDFIIKISYNI